MPRKIRTVLLIATLVLLLVVVISFVIKPRTNQINTLTLTGDSGPAINSVAPNFNLPLLNGGSNQSSISLEHNQNVLVTFFASWCTDCKQDLSLLGQYQNKLGYKVIGIDSGDTRTAGNNLIKEYKLDFPVGYDPDETLIIGSYNTRGLPFSVLINSKGLVVATHLGPLTLTLLRDWQNKL